MSRRLLLACLLLPCTLLAEEAGLQPIEMPDVRANVIKMLQEGKHEGMEPGEESYRQESQPAETATADKKSGAPAAKVPPGEQDLFSIANEQKKAEEKPGNAGQKAVPEQQAAEPEKKKEKPLYLPSKEITIQDADDLKKLIREFEEARKRQQGQ